MDKIKFLMGLHCHQPVDNFKEIFEGAYEKSYKPFLDVLERHPNIKITFHSEEKCKLFFMAVTTKKWPIQSHIEKREGKIV